MKQHHSKKHQRRQEPVQPLEARRLLSAAANDPLRWLAYAPYVTPVTTNQLVQQFLASQSKSAASTGSGVSGSSSPAKPAAAVADAVPNTSPDVLTGSLAGRVLFTSGGHGYVWRDPTRDGATAPGYWGVMRSYGYNFMEDMGNQDQVQPYADYALHSGATVVAMRPVGHQANEYVMDNAMGYSAATGGFQVISGSWSGNTSTTPYWSVNNGNDVNHWMFASASATETAVARYTPNMPSAGFYPVYAWTNPGQNNTSNDRIADQTYRINYTGGSTEVKVAQNKVGNGWIYLGTYYFAQGVSGANVEISNKTSGTTTGKYVVADGIRFGNGMGDWTEYGTHPVSGYSREDECALYWCYGSLGWTGNGTRVSDDVVDAGFTSGDESKNFFACDRYAAYMNNSAVGARNDRLWLSFHSNASGSSGTGGTGRGTAGLITGSPTTNQVWLAQTAGSTVQTEMVAAGFNWATKSDPTFTGGYSEISNGSTYINGEFDATIIEVAYHDNATDNALLKDPSVRWAVGRSTYHTAVKFFQNFGSLTNTTLLPEPPVNVRATTDTSGNVTVSWTPGPSSSGLTGPYGNAATSYRVHTSTYGYGFDGGVVVSSGTSLNFTGLSTTSPTYFMVTAVNSGGESLNSYVVVAKPQTTGRAPVLVVNGFTRMDGVSDEIETKSFGTVYRARARYNNSYDYVTQIAPSLVAYNPALGFESAPASAIAAGLVNLSDYQAVIWMTGEQATTNFTTFDSTTQTLVSNYLSAGGKLFVSGSNVAFNLSSSGDNKGNSFLSSGLHAGYVRDDSNTYNFAAGVAGSAFAGVPAGSFDNGTHGGYDVDAADGLSTANGSTAALSYSGGTGGTAAVQWASGNSRVILLAFPIESVYTLSTRNALVAGAMNYFGLSSTGTPVTTPAPGTPDLADASDFGPLNNDNVTNLNNIGVKKLQFTVPNTVAGATVQLFSDGTLIGQATASGTSTLITTNGTAVLTNAAHSITAVQTSPGATASLSSAALTVTIDTTAPTATISAINNPRSTPLPSATVTFSKPVYGLDPADLALTRDGAAVPYSAAQTFSVTGNVYTLTNLSAVTANAGAYSLSLSASTSGVTDLAGNPLSGDRVLPWVLNVINGTAASDNILIARNAANPAALDVTVNANPTYTLNLATVGDLTVNADAGDDVITLDLSAGNPTFNPGASLTLLTGDASAAGDSLFIRGTAGDDALTLTDSTFSLNGGPTLSYFTGSTTPVAVSFQGTTGNDSLSVTNKSLYFAADASLANANLTLNLGTGASATFAATQHLAALNLTDDATATLTTGGNKVLVTGGLSISGTAKLDLTDNDLAVNAGLTQDQVRQLLAAVRLFSSTAAANPNHTTALGYALASDLGVSLFSNQPVASTALLVKYTYAGDTDLDGRVTADDLARIDRGRAKGLSTWLWGDVDYTGTVTSADVSLASAAFRDQGAPL